VIPAEAVVSAARGWLGVPYLHQGRSRFGVDCLGLVLEVGRELGFLPGDLDYQGYGRQPLRSFLEARVREHCAAIDEPRPGALVVIRWSQVAAHLAIATDATLVHACASRRMVVEHGYRGVWRRLTHSVWALPGVSYV
jgi:cell wall-associated NlpC family hydrolase